MCTGLGDPDTVCIVVWCSVCVQHVACMCVCLCALYMHVCTCVYVAEVHCVCVRTMPPTENFIVTEDHDAELEDEISVPEGAVVEVTVKKLSGWWQVRYV